MGKPPFTNPLAGAGGQKSPGRSPDPGGGSPGGPPKAGADMVLARFLRLCSAVLSTPVPQEAAALTVNRIAEVVRVDRAVLVHLKGKHAIRAVTGGGKSAQDSAFADAVGTVRARFRDRQEPVVVPPAEGGRTASESLKKVQDAMGGTTILWLPLWLDREGKVPPTYALWLERWRGIPWDRTDIELMQHAALFLGHGIARPRTPAVRSRKRLIRSVIALCILLLLAVPVTSSVTAPARVEPDRPHHIFAPMDGILKELMVQPGQTVKQGAVLFRYDSRVLEKRLDEAYRDVAVARAKLVRLQGAAHRDREARAELPVRKLEVERAQADVEYYTRQLERSEVETAKAGVIVLDDPDALIGAALQTGQAVLSVADPEQTKVRIMVPTADVGLLEPGARVKLRLDSDPLTSLPAVVTRIGFEVRVSESMIPSVVVEAVWTGEPPEVHPGQKGSAKIYGDSTLLGMQILRKPLIAARNFVGL